MAVNIRGILAEPRKPSWNLWGKIVPGTLQILHGAWHNMILRYRGYVYGEAFASGIGWVSDI